MPPRREPPSIEESMAAMVENISKLLASSNDNTERIITMQTTALHDQQTQLDIIVQQLATQFEQTNKLFATLQQQKPTTPHQHNPPPPPPPPIHNIRLPKITLPTFDGPNPLDWLFQAEQYFSLYNIPPNQRTTMIAFYLSGDALSWYKYLVNNRLLTTWPEFTRALETRFGPSSYDNHQAALFKLRQTSSITSYQTEFEKLSNCVVGLPQDALLNCFISGLKHEIQQELAILRPTSLTQAIGLAKLIEDKLNDNLPSPVVSAPLLQSNQPLLLPPPKPPPVLPIKKLTPDEMQKRRVKGLCYNCPEKYQPGHRCKPPQFLLLQSEHDPPWNNIMTDNLGLKDKAGF